MKPNTEQISPVNSILTGFDDLLETEEGDDDLFYSIKGQESYSSLHSAATSATEPCSRETSRKSTRSSKDASRKSSRSRSRRNPRTKSSAATAAFDPTRVPQKSSMKQKSISASSPTQQRRRKRSGIYRVHLPKGLKSVKRQRSIRFNDEVSVREVRSLRSLVNDNIRILWWQDDEHACIKENLQRLLSRVNSKGVSRSNGRKYCTRGLERFMDTQRDWEANRLEAEEAVLCEQSLQHERGTFDDLRIAAAYFRSTQISQQEAADMGIEDAFVARSILEAGPFPSLNSGSSGSMNASIDLSSSPLPLSLRSTLNIKSSSFRHHPEQKQQLLRRSRSFHQHRPVASMA